MENSLFKAADLYVMVRLSMIEYFPYPATDIEPCEVLTIYMRKALGLDIHIQDVQGEKELTFKGKSYEIYKDMEKHEAGPDHSAAWYVTKVAKWGKRDLDNLASDLDVIRTWLNTNEYVKNNRPTDKFLQQEFLAIADAAAQRRKAL
ncbi:hypothetical protein [Serratia sp. UGAL515B_01]|uniref:hypothetical protein n=1 Tax=Serratia sp. UGAL515B_01 TaxID=2986763 RepID=UPI00295427AD|nr:hypothetical protein [Serratia sp. UGAL515B_01]WON75551.1 hypothetical protein OK023_00100 [Serratia sp. UGAL515B_01]